MTEIIELNGPEIEPAAGGPPKMLVILMHGYGADGNDLIGLAPHYAQMLPDAHFISPNAPHPCGAGFGFQWYDVWNPDDAAKLEQIRDAARSVNAFIDAQLARHGLTDVRMALVGFSQGTMMSLFTAPRREAACAGVMGYSGRLDSPELLEREIRSRPPVTLVHGDRDELLPVTVMEDAAAALQANGVEVETHLRPGLGHGIDDVGLQIGMRFLGKVLGGGA